MAIVDAILLGVVQGITEFLPISSSGHLILAREVLGISLSGSLAFDAVLHFATALAVVVYFWRDIGRLIEAGVRLVSGREVFGSDKKMLFAIAIATIPAVILGLLLEDFMESVFRNATLVAVALVIGSFIMLAAERAQAWVARREGAPSAKRALIIGFFQSLALVPGMSRSGMAISGGLALGMTREQAARFAFLLAVPLLLGAGAKKALEIAGGSAAGQDVFALMLGALAAFTVGLAAIHWLLRFLRNNSLLPFIIYRFALAGVVLIAIL